ncbi:cytochrome P450 [Actinomadura fulvescens]|uniref:Cytochrome P450 n=1 Tax=Actinomadura fulvescens TaxID=46160 RepID=A0ABP6D9D6_9ACTN
MGEVLDVAGKVTQTMARLRSGSGRQDPYPGYELLRAQGPLLPTLWGGLLATDHATCGRVLRSPQWGEPDPVWKDRWIPGWREHLSLTYAAQTVMQLNPPEHADQRARAAACLSAGRLAGLEPVIERMVQERLQALVAELAERGRADFARLVADPLPMMVICALVGLPEDDAWWLVGVVRKFTCVMELSPSRHELEAADDAVAVLQEYGLKALERQRQARAQGRPGAGLLGDLAAQPLNEHDVQRTGLLIITLLITGWQTTASLLGSIVLALDRFPDQAAWLRRHPGQIGQAVDEVLRWDPPIQVVSRVALCDTELAGTPVPAGQLVHALVGSAHYDPLVVTNPQRLDFSRAQRGLLAFGRGPHYCLGAQLTRCEGALVLSQLLERFDRLRVAQIPGRPCGIAFRGITSLVVEAG